MALELLEAPTGDVVSVSTLKAALRIDGSELDATLALWLPVAVSYLERSYGLAMLTQAWRVWVDRDALAADAAIVLPIWPVASVDAVTTYDDDGVGTVLDDANYLADTVSQAARVQLRAGAFWPSGVRAINAVAIDVTAGYGAASAVPALVVRAVALLVAHWIENPDGVSAAGGAIDELPWGVRALMHTLAPVRLA